MTFFVQLFILIDMNRTLWTTKEKDTLKDIFEKKWNINEAVLALGRSPSNIYKKCKELGLKIPRGILTLQTMEAMKKGKRICRHCQKEKDTSEFGLRGKNSKMFKSVCHTCEAEIAINKYRSKTCWTLEESLVTRLNQAKQRANRKRVEFDLTFDDLMEAYKKQGGKCFYSGIEMEKVPKRENYHNLSVDRVESDKGYIKDNIVLCCDSINTMKNSMPVSVFIDICKKIVLHQEGKIQLS